ncbi:MAG: response regulator [Oscillatoriales cyanobacterium RM2_1_1]|nr:response regulator [Oscillatoriales cyanobacterium RM2_1_1]
MNILLVEDDVLLARGMAKLIERMSGHRVQVSTDPEQIFRDCYGGKIDLILMDINLPGARWQGENVSGADLSRALKADPQTHRTPIILLTAYAMNSERESLLKISEADEFQMKPIADYDKLILLINHLINQPQSTSVNLGS